MAEEFKSKVKELVDFVRREAARFDNDFYPEADFGGQSSLFLGDPRFDSQAKKILGQGVIRVISHIIGGTTAATAANYGTFFVADRPFVVIGFSENHRTAGTDGGAVTIQLEKLTSGTAEDSGTNLLATALSLKATVNTPQHGVLTNTKTDLILRRGDRLAIADAGALTTVAHVTITLFLIEI